MQHAESARQNSNERPDLKIKLKKRWKSLLIGVIILPAAVATVYAVMLFHRPGEYDPPARYDETGPSRHLTNEILPTIYNQAQLGEPFEIEISEQAANDILWSSPVPSKLGFMGFTGADAKGQLRFPLTDIRIGAAGANYLTDELRRQLAAAELGVQEFGFSQQQTAIEKVLFADQGIEPVFEVDNRQLTVSEVNGLVAGCTGFFA